MTKREEFLVLYTLEGFVEAAHRNEDDMIVRGQALAIRNLAKLLGIPKDKLDSLEKTAQQKVASERGE